ncbi:secreted RxLR effector protein 161-like [Malus sylvestris]|uniref:secreted RxLR effector protein 161-like n=1 Tax=Malus sylvestris TaxID=3752 RepID=UPI0021ABB805|nr:secreted RxLR effector protein 161-like [Malus sylvestris]
MEHCKPTSTPSKPHTQLLVFEGIPMIDPTLYRSLVGALQYLTFSRPNIAYSVNMVCQFMNNPTDLHLHLVKRILRYLQGTITCGLKYTKGEDMSITTYSDSDWASNINTRRSITGYVVYLGSNPISWQSKKQSTVSRSSTEAEYKAIAHYTADIFWIRSLLRDMHQFLPPPSYLHCDNLSALAICSNPDYHFVREKVQKGDMRVQYLPTKEQVADVLTKGLHSPIFVKHCHNLSLGSQFANSSIAVRGWSLAE